MPTEEQRQTENSDYLKKLLNNEETCWYLRINGERAKGDGNFFNTYVLVTPSGNVIDPDEFLANLLDRFCVRPAMRIEK